MSERIPIARGFNKHEIVGWMQLDEGVVIESSREMFDLMRLEGSFEYDAESGVWHLVEVSIVPRHEGTTRP